MYTIDDKEKEYDEEEEYEETFWERNRGLIIKFIIIVLCVIVLIWLISALKGSNGNEIAFDQKTHDENVLKVRLAAEKYFFIDGNMPNGDLVKTVELSTLINKNLVTEVVDANNKVCNDSRSTVSLKKESTYVMRINLSCSTKENEEVFFYSLNENNKCLNCQGKTNMDGSGSSEASEDDFNYSCKIWSEWTENRVTSNLLDERSRVLVKGVKEGKKGETKVYGEWSEYTETPIEANESLEVEQLTKTEKRWGEIKTTTTPVSNSDTVKLISTTRGGSSTYKYCPSGYTKDGNRCLSKETFTGDLDYVKYNSYVVTNKPCNSVKTEKNSDGKYVVVYKGCTYKKTTALKTKTGSSSTIYSYQELEDTQVTYYRSRAVRIVEEQEEDIYTQDYYEETNLPTGYKKVPGSEKIQYSYRLSTCEK